MQAPDVNVLLYAFRIDDPQHELARGWLDNALASQEPLGVSELALSGFIRIVTQRAVTQLNAPMDLALEFVDTLLAQPNVLPLRPGARHWDIFTGLCRLPTISGKRVADAYHAALAIETGSEWITTDHDFGRFPGLRWRNPLLDL